MAWTPRDLDLMTRTVLAEAGRQGPLGMSAVAHVILNRMASGEWGPSAADVILAKNQFEPVSRKESAFYTATPASSGYQQAARIVSGVISGQLPDPTRGATHFLNPEIVRERRGGSLPGWAQGSGLRIGDHVFYAPDGPVEGQIPMIDPTLTPPMLTPVNTATPNPSPDALAALASPYGGLTGGMQTGPGISTPSPVPQQAGGMQSPQTPVAPPQGGSHVGLLSRLLFGNGGLGGMINQAIPTPNGGAGLLGAMFKPQPQSQTANGLPLPAGGGSTGPGGVPYSEQAVSAIPYQDGSHGNMMGADPAGAGLAPGASSGGPGPSSAGPGMLMGSL